MTTPELIAYILGELAKGKRREEISESLMSAGQWTRADLSEAFRKIMPVGDLSLPKPKTKPLRRDALFIVLGLICAFLLWFYRPQIAVFFSSFFNRAPILADLSVKDCGNTNAPNIGNSATYENNTVLSCLGENAILCKDAKAEMKNTIFPTVFSITKVGNYCTFRLSYEENTSLTDPNGNELAGQYISCPIGIVKVLDESNPQSPVFKIPDRKDLSQYAAQIYYYGTLGVFMENGLDKNTIRKLGCSGFYIDSAIASYNKL